MITNAMFAAYLSTLSLDEACEMRDLIAKKACEGRATNTKFIHHEWGDIEPRYAFEMAVRRVEELEAGLVWEAGKLDAVPAGGLLQVPS